MSDLSLALNIYRINKKTNNNSINHTDCDIISSGSFIDADSFFDASEQLKPESPHCNDQWKGKGKQRQVF